MVGQLPKERRRRLSAQPAVQTDPGADGIAIGLDGHIYSDTAITDAVAQVGQLGPLNPKVAVCHFPPQDRSQWQASPLLALQACRPRTCVRGSSRRAPSGPSQCGGLSAYWPEERSTRNSGAHCMLLMWYRADSRNSSDAIAASCLPSPLVQSGAPLNFAQELRLQHSDMPHTRQGMLRGSGSRTVLSLGGGSAGEVP